MHWKQATLGQLYEIAYNDPGASAIHKQQAQAEIKRRKPQRWGKVNQKIKEAYPR